MEKPEQIKREMVKHVQESTFEWAEHEMDSYQVDLAKKLADLFESKFPPMISDDGKKIFVHTEDKSLMLDRVDRELGFGQYRITIESISDIRY